MKVLIVEDQAENRYLLESLLRGHGWQVEAAANGTLALELLQQDGFELIISDILMPVMDGFELCRRVKGDERLRAIPLIIYTATYTGPQDEALARQLGADCFIQKPCEPEQMMARVNEVLAAGPGPAGGVEPALDQTEVLSLYNERLVRKLEQKMFQAETEIQARQAAEHRLRELTARLIEAQRLAGMGDFTWDLESGEITWSEALYDLLGYDRQEVFDLERVDSQVHHPQDRERIGRWLQEELASGSGRLRPYEYRILHRDGTVLEVRAVGEISHRPGRQPLVFATVQDISERRHAEAALRASETKFRNLFHRHAAVKFLIDPDCGAIVDANQAAADFYGWSIDQLKQMRIQQINTLPPEQVLAEMARAKRQQRIHFEFSHRLADGSQRTVAVFSSGIEIDGKTFLHAIVHDISRRIKLEEQLRQAQKLESIGRLAGGVAHDFNNMLSVILGNADLALTKTPIDQPAHDQLEQIVAAANRSTELTRQLLAFARQQPIAPRVVDLNEALEQLLKMLQRLIGETVELSWRPAASLEPIEIDPSQLDQLLTNLCVNARDALNGAGHLTIETGQVNLGLEDCEQQPGAVPGGYVVLTVSDDGCGMDADIRSKIFEPFFTTKEAGKGTGLGLATVYGIVKQHHGFISVYSEPDLGTTFRIYFPCYTGETQTASTSEPLSIPSGRGETILVVEDEAAILDLVRRMLDDLGYQVLTAAHPQDALQLDAPAASLDLLLSDVVMPGMNGRSLARQLKQLHPGLRVLFMSGYAADVIAQQGILEDGIDFIQKPFAMSELARKVRDVLAGPVAGKAYESVSQGPPRGDR